MLKQPQLSVNEILFLDLMCALLVHLVYNRYEVPPSEILPTLVLLAVIPLFPGYILAIHPNFTPSWLAIMYSYIFFYTVLASSIFLYRLSPLHPLAHFPGPRIARTTQLWGALLTLRGKRHQELKRLHDQYGSYVRIGPNELSCIDAEAIPHVLGTEGLPKGPIWDARTVPGNPISLIALRDRTEHHRRRQLWNRALNTHAVKEYEDALIARVYTLSDQLAKYSIQTKHHGSRTEKLPVLDLTEWFNHFAFDFMGDMAFGGGFDLLRRGDEEGVRRSLEDALWDTALMAHVPWLTPLLWKIRVIIARRVKFVKFTKGLVIERVKKPPKRRDLVYHLADEDNISANKPMIGQVLSDAMLTVIAGSDTTATTLGTIFYCLLTNPNSMKRLREEVDPVLPSKEGGPVEARRLAELPYLNAVINEGLRLGPPLPTNIQRATPRQSRGKWIGKRYIPPGTAINIPAYALHRCASYFSPNPDSFWPERWLKSSTETPAMSDDTDRHATESHAKPVVNVTTNGSAFVPFSFGPANCVGKNLAMVEMRMVVAMLVTRFDLQISHEYNPRDWYRDQEDFGALKNGRLPVVLMPRSVSISNI